MGREVKRVALDFSWPLKQRWQGYLNPHRVPLCEACDGDGGSPWARRFAAEWYGRAPFDPAAYGATPLTADHPLVVAFARRNVERDHAFYAGRIMGYGTGEEAVRREAERLWDHWRGQWSHHLVQADVDALVKADRLRDIKSPSPTAAEVNDWSISGGFGHDAINQWVCVRARCKRERVPVRCAYCKGSGEDGRAKAIKRKHDAWSPTEPPEGDGWQMWETTSEGSPISPVFATPEELARWLADNGASTFGSDTGTYEQWLRMITGAGWAPSAVVDERGVRSGVEACP